MDLFVYGTLTASDLVHSLTGRSFDRLAACLHGFRRFQSAGSYPYIVASPGDRVDGILLRGLAEDDLRAIDQYEAEGDLYFRIDVVAETAGGERPCATYVVNSAAIERLRIA